MTMLRVRKMLGLALEERSLRIAEIRLADGRWEAVRGAEFHFPEGASWEEPGRLGSLLRSFMLEHGFSTKRAVMGLPAKWLLVKEKQVPPASPDSVAGMMRIEAEREFSSEAADLVFDCCDVSDPEQARRVLLMATLREKVERVVAMGQAARLSVRAITSSATALASATRRSESGSGLTLHLTPAGIELTVQAGKQFRMVRHLPLAASAPPEAGSGPDEQMIGGIADKVRGVVSLLPGSQDGQELDRLSIWDGIGLESDALRTLGGRLDVQASVEESLSALGIAESRFALEPGATRSAAAAALGLAGIRPDELAVDFLHSRLAAARKTAFGRRAVWAAGIAVALIVAGLAVLMDWQSKEREIAALHGRLEGMKEDIEAAEHVVERVSLARGWYGRRPRFLDCLRGLTLAFPEEGRIWTTSLALSEDMRGIVSGNSLDERTVLELLDDLKESEGFSDLKLLYMREAGGRSREVSFAISFSFLTVE